MVIIFFCSFVQLLEGPFLEITMTGARKSSSECCQKFSESTQTNDRNFIPKPRFGRPGMLPQSLSEELIKCPKSAQTVKDHDSSS